MNTTIAEKLKTIIECKNNIKTAINKYNATIYNTTPLTKYEDKIKNISYPIIGEGKGQYRIECYDYDGALLKIDHLNKGEKFVLPNPPTHDRLVFGGWTCPIPINDDNTITVPDNIINCGATYRTISGNTEIFVELDELTGKTLTMYCYAGHTIDWGDGTTDTNSTTSEIDVSHTYNNYGKFIIKIISNTPYALNSLFKYDNGYQTSNTAVKRIHIGDDVSSSGSFMQSLTNLNAISYPSNSTFKNISFYHIESILDFKCVVIPQGVTTIPVQGFNGTTNFKTIIMPTTLNNVGLRAFQNCASRNMVLPNNWINIAQHMFETVNCQHIIVSDNISQINGERFASGCNFLKEFNGKNTKVVGTANNMFSNCFSIKHIKNLKFSGIGAFNNFVANCYNLTKLFISDIKVNLQLSNGTSWGLLLTQESLINTIQELWDVSNGTAMTLTISQINLDKISNVYVRLIPITDQMRVEDEYIDNKKPFEVCESTDEGAMLITDYVTLKNWSLA